MSRPSGRRALAALGRFTSRSGVIFLWSVPFALVAVLADPFVLLRPAPPESIARLVMFPLFVPYGFLIFAEDAVQKAIVRQRWAAFVLALALSTVPPLVSQGIKSWGWKLGFPGYILLMAAGALLIWSCVLAVIGFALRHWDVNRPLLTYANEAVLPFYILHQPVILLIGFYVVRLDLPILVKYLMICSSAFAVTLGLYEFGVRRWNPVRRLFGLKPKAREANSRLPSSGA